MSAPAYVVYSDYGHQGEGIQGAFADFDEAAEFFSYLRRERWTRDDTYLSRWVGDNETILLRPCLHLMGKEGPGVFALEIRCDELLGHSGEHYSANHEDRMDWKRRRESKDSDE